MRNNHARNLNLPRKGIRRLGNQPHWLSSQIINKYDIKIVSKTKDPLISMSGFHVIPDYTAGGILNDNISNYPMLILSGGM